MKDNDAVTAEVDEGTSLYDDDGDGFAEVDNVATIPTLK